ncbi:hypothetical protein LINGRAPRIM_LOCUS467 [Linum grandiflorum]
MTISGETE